VQGYYVSKPMIHEEFLKFIAISEWLETTAWLLFAERNARLADATDHDYNAEQ
jgi:hypothetical protein